MAPAWHFQDLSEKMITRIILTVRLNLTLTCSFQSGTLYSHLYLFGSDNPPALGFMNLSSTIFQLEAERALKRSTKREATKRVCDDRALAASSKAMMRATRRLATITCSYHLGQQPLYYLYPQNWLAKRCASTPRLIRSFGALFLIDLKEEKKNTAPRE